MELSVEEMFGYREAESLRGSGSEVEDDDSEDDDGGQNNPMEEAVEDPEPGQEPSSEPQPVKPKRVIKNPQPKLDAQRLAGPRGIAVIQKSYKDTKFRGKGHEKEDLDVLLKKLEHWAHRLFPKLPFRDTLEQLEKLGSKKNVQVLIKRFRLDLFTENEPDGLGEDNVKRGIDEEENIEEPTVDVFDELLGNSGFPASQYTPLPEMTTESPSQSSKTLTSEQRERLEEKKRLAAEKRLTRMKEQEEEKAKDAASFTENSEPEMESQDISAFASEDGTATGSS